MAGTSYTRQSTIADGNLITAALFNNEFNQIVNAFAYSASGTTGHTHDGSAAQGGAISKIGDQDFKNKIEVSVTNNRIEFYSEVGGSPVEQVRIQDGAIVPVTDSDVDLGTTSVRFKDAYVDSVTVTNNIVVAGTVDGRDVATDGTKLDGIEASATADQTDAEIRAAVEAATDSNVFTDADHTKLNAIEASADVTDTANVTAAGALMDSEVDADIKTLVLPANTTISDYGKTLVDDADAAAARTTLGLGTVATTAATDYATAAQGTTADAALPKAGGAMTGAITTNSTFDGRDVATDGTKLDGIEASADVTDATNVTAAGALMDSEVTNLAQVKAFNSADYATAAQGTTADAALPKSGGAMTGAITTNSTFDGRDVATDGTKLDGIEASADVTDATNVTAAGALMDSELTAIASVKALNQGVATTDSPTFTNLTLTGTDSVKVPSGTTAQRSGSPANGMFRYNSTTAEFEGYQDGAWGGVGGGSATVHLNQFTGDGSDTTFTLSGAASENNTFVFIDGVYQSKDNYTVSAVNPAVVTFSTAPPNTTAIEIMVSTISVSDIGTPSDNTVSTAKIVDGAVTPAKIASGDFNFAKNDQTNGSTLSITNSANGGGWDAGDIIGSINFRTDDVSTTQPIRGQIKVFDDAASGATYPNTNAMSFSTGLNNDLNERLRITSAGDVGIGTTSPAQALTVNGTDARIYLTGANTDIAMDSLHSGQLSLDGNAYGFGIALNASGAHLYTNSATRDLIFGVNETEVARLTPTNFTVTAATDPTITVKATGTGDADADIILDANDTGESGVVFNNSGVKKARVDWSNQNLQLNMATESGTNGTIDFQPNDVLAMRITAAGVAEFKAGITEDSVTLSGTSTTIDLATATNFVHDLTGNTTYTFSNPATSGNASAFTLKIIQGSTARTITWPASVDWAGGTAPTLSSANNAVDIFTFFTLDGGTTYYGFTAGQAMA